MIITPIVNVSAITIFTFGQLLNPVIPSHVLSSHEISLQDRYPVASVSEVFKDNILLNLAYMSGKVNSKQDIDWNQVTSPFHYELSLNPGEVFAYHDDVLPEFKGKMGKTTRAHFTAQEGFKTDGYLYGDGVCHLASLMYWVAKDAKLDALAPTNHDFMNIPEINKQYGVSIFSNPSQTGYHSTQNLYITNNRTKMITFLFDWDGNKLKASVAEAN